LKPVEIRAAANERRPPSEAFGCDKIFWEMSKRVLFARLRCGANTMFTAYIIVTGLTVAANIFAAVVDFLRCQWVLERARITTVMAPTKKQDQRNAQAANVIIMRPRSFPAR
jgi:hypothetical protein